jgi:predicted RNase H-like HicB family nuclease
MELVVKIAVGDNGRFRAWCPSLPGCMVKAESEEEALRKIETIIRSYLLGMNAVPPAELGTRVQRSLVAVG